jgi:hypothetical protein
MGILVGVHLHPSLHGYPGSMPDNRVHHRSSHEYLRVVTVREEGKGETVVTTPDRLDWFSCLK